MSAADHTSRFPRFFTLRVVVFLAVAAPLFVWLHAVTH